MHNKYFKLLEQAYSLTDNVTPRRFDCGKLCGAVCCENLSHSTHSSGMLLLPYEKEFLESRSAKEFSFEHTEDGDILICNGKCNRNNRPFACRIFPYYACFKNNGILLKKDLRAAGVCPLLTNRSSRRPSIYFIRGMKKAVKLLASDSVYYKDFIKTSDFIDSLYDLYSKMK